jgi:hypothetical protein
MVMRIQPWALLFLSGMMISSCTQPRYVYNQPARNLHYFTDKGQAVIGASWAGGPSRDDNSSGNNYNHGADFQGAYSISSHWAVMASYYQRNERDLIHITDGYGNTIENSDVKYKRNGWEIGASYYLPLGKQMATFFYVDGGFGFTNNELNDNSNINSNYILRYFKNQNSRFFLQPGLYTGKGAIRFNMGLRWQLVSFNNTQTNYSQIELSDYSLSGLNEIQTIEPIIAFRFGPKSLPWIKADLQFSIAAVNKGYYIRNAYASFGLSFYPLATK